MLGEVATDEGSAGRGQRDLRQWGLQRWPFVVMRLPILDWLPEYTVEMLYQDLIAGLTVFVFLVPQGMAYAILAGMPPVYGLYSSTVPLFLYAVLGTSRQLSIGPMAITSLLLGVTCQKYGYTDGSSEYIQIAMNISMLVGLITFFMGSCSMGTLSNLISPSVLTGFLTASSLVIAINQIKYVFGIHMPRFAYSHQTIIYILTHLGESHIWDVVLGMVSWAALLVLREVKKRYKAPDPQGMDVWSRTKRVLFILSNLAPFFSIVVGGVFARWIILSGGVVRVVGDVPRGLLAPGFVFLPMHTLSALLPSAVAIAFVAFAGNWAVAKKYSTKHKYKVDATQELLAQGYTITVGVLFNAFVVSGGLARSAVNAEAGAVTQLASCFTAIGICLCLLCMTSFLYYIPMAVLGAVIEVSIVSMLDFAAMREAYHKDRRDFLVMTLTFFVTFFVGVTTGLFAGIFLSIYMVLYSAAFPVVAHLGRLPTGYWKDLRRFPGARQVPGVAVIRMDASLFFANAGHFKETCLQSVAGAFHDSLTPVTLLVVDCSAYTYIDLTGLHVLEELRAETAQRGIRLGIVGAKGVLRDQLRRGGFTNKETGEEDILYFSIEDALSGRPSSRSFQCDPSAVRNPLAACIEEENEEGEDAADVELRTYRAFEGQTYSGVHVNNPKDAVV